MSPESTMAVYTLLILMSLATSVTMRLPSPVFSPHSDSVPHSESKNSPPSHRQSSVFLCAGILRCGGCNTQETALQPEQVQIFFKLDDVKGVGLEVNRRVCLCVSCNCMCVREWGGGGVFGLQPPQRGPMCCYQPLGLWDWQMEPRKQRRLFISWNKCESQGPRWRLYDYMHLYHGHMQWILHNLFICSLKMFLSSVFHISPM